MQKACRHIWFGGLLMIVIVIGLAFAYFHFRYDFFDLGRPCTLMEAIAKGNVRAVKKFLQEEGVETGPSSLPYLTRAIYWRPSFFRRDYKPTEKQIARRNETTYKMVKLLVEHGANINRADERFHGDTPLIAALHLRMQNVVQYLIQQGASTEVFNADSESPLMYAAMLGDVATVQLLLDHNAKKTINHARNDGKTAIDLTYDSEIVELLLKNGAVSQKNVSDDE